MATEWAQSQRSGWLCRLYGTTSTSGERRLPPDSAQFRLISNLENLLLFETSPEECAAETASIILAEHDVGTPWQNHIGMYLGAAEHVSGEAELTALVRYLVSLTKLPEAVNEWSEARLWDPDGGEPYVGPGARIPGEKCRLWRDLPDFSMNVTESWQGGPIAYLRYCAPSETPNKAKTRWRNLNTWLALLCRDDEAKTIPALSHWLRWSTITLGLALEYSPNTREGLYTDLKLPAAEQWLRIAGEEIRNLCEKGTVRFQAGDLWARQGGSDVCDVARLQFWEQRVRQLDVTDIVL